MGYPMSYKRVINRNRLAEGDYQDIKEVSHYYNGMTKEQVSLLLGDLRRLEKDSVDEKATAAYIALRTNIDVEIVSAVLKEFFNW